MKIIRKIVSLIFLIVFLPIALIASIAIIINDGYPILFKQKRVGLDSAIFWIYKFRTMKKNAPNLATHLMEESKEDYYTKVGMILRKLSLDELPQLINIIYGEMAFIGPRPALYNQLNLIKKRTEKGINKILPGITGWAQINGRDNLTTEQKVSYDDYYLRNQNVIFDIKILLITIFKISTSDGVKK